MWVGPPEAISCCVRCWLCADGNTLCVEDDKGNIASYVAECTGTLTAPELRVAADGNSYSERCVITYFGMTVGLQLWYCDHRLKAPNSM